MKLEDQVCNYEQAVKFKKLLNPTPSLFIWSKSKYYPKNNPVLDYFENNPNYMSGFIRAPYENFPAYTVAELMDMLPKELKLKWNYKPNIRFEFNQWQISYDSIEEYGRYHDVLYVSDSKNLAGCAANTLIWLLENKHINVNDLNKGQYEMPTL